MKINRLQNNEVTEIAASVLALALVLPVMGGVVYGFETGWDALGFSAVGVMALLMAAYYLILRVMLRYQKFYRNLSPERGKHSFATANEPTPQQSD